VAPPIYDFTWNTVALTGQVNAIEHLLLPAVPEFLGALAAGLVSAAVTWAIQKWRKRGASAVANDGADSFTAGR
jgi:hypothetical protein